MFYRSSVFPQLTNTFLFGMLKGEGIMRVTFDTQHPPQVISYEKLAGIQAGRVRDVVEGPDGFIYFTTSNQDGRGKAQAGDDHIYRLVPSKHE
jgi:glucose/arabinose dehydrogenase